MSQIRQIANSIEAFGFNVPVLVDAELNVICGHGRLLACRELGWTEVPTLCLDHLTPAQARAFMIADNRLTEISSWKRFAGCKGCGRTTRRRGDAQRGARVPLRACAQS
jgi:ParB-like chromosome segregation protein Spo0J